MHLSCTHQMGAVALIEVIQVGDVLEVVGIQLTAFHRGIGNDVIVELRDLQGDALLGQQIPDHFQDLSVRAGEAPTFTVVPSREAEGRERRRAQARRWAGRRRRRSRPAGPRTRAPARSTEVTFFMIHFSFFPF